MENFPDYLKIDEKIIFERFEFQLMRLVPQARMLGFLAFQQEFLLNPLLAYIKDKAKMKTTVPTPEQIFELFENETLRNPELLYVFNLHAMDLKTAKDLFKKDWTSVSLTRKYDFNVVWVMTHKQINAFAQKYFYEMKMNCFTRILYENSLILTSPEEIRRNAVLSMNLNARTEFENQEKDPLKQKFEIANQFFRKTDYITAEILYKELIESAEEQDRIDILAKAKGNLGMVCKMLFRNEEAIEYLEKQFEIDQKLGGILNMLSSYGNQASIYSDTGNFFKALQVLDLKEKLELKNDCFECFCETLNNRGNIFLKQNFTDKAIECFRQQEEIALDHGFKKNLAICHHNLGLVYEKRMEPDALLNALRKEEEILLELALGEDLAHNWSRQAILYLNFGNQAEAFRLFEIEAEYHQKNKNLPAYSNCLSNLAIVLNENKNHEDALRLLHEEEKIKIEEGLEADLADCFSKRAVSYCMLSKFEEAKQEIFKREKTEDPNDFLAVAETLHTKAQILFYEEDYSSCLTLLEKESEICKNLNNLFGTSDCYELMAKACLKLDNPEKAEELLKIRLHIEEKNQRTTGMIKTYRLLAKATKSLGKFEDTFAYNQYASKLENYHEQQNSTLNPKKIQQFIKKHFRFIKLRENASDF